LEAKLRGMVAPAGDPGTGERAPLAGLSATLDCLPGAVVITDERGNVVAVNTAAEAITGWRQQDALGLPAAEVYPVIVEQSRAPAESPSLRALRGSVVERGLLLVTRTGAERAIDVDGGPIRGRSGELVAGVVVLRDAERGRSGKPEVADSEELVHLLIESLKDYAIFMLDPTGRVVSWNAGAERIKGYRAAEIIGRHFSAFYPHEALSAGRPAQALEVAARAGRHEEQGWRVRKDGSRFWADVVLTSVHDRSGHLRGFAKVTRDFSERRRAEETARRLETETAARRAAEAAEARLRESEERYRLQGAQLAIILANVGDGVTAHDARGQIFYANDAAARLCGYPSGAALQEARPGEVLARFEVFGEDDRPLPAERLPGRRVFLGEDEPSQLVRVRARDSGREWWSMVRAHAVRDQDGKPWLAVNIWRDVTEQRLAEIAREYLAEATAVLSGALDYPSTLERVARLIVPRLADCCVVHVREGSALVPVTVTHVDPHKAGLARELMRRFPVDLTAPRGLGGVMKTGVAQLFAHVTDADLVAAARGDEHLAALRGLAPRSVLVVALPGRAGTLGALTLVAAESGRRFTENDLALCEELGRRAGIAIENAQLYREATEAVRVRDEFLSVAGHELKTPLAALLLQVAGLSRALKRDPQHDPARLIDRLDKAAASGTRLEKLIDELLDISRITSGRLLVEPEQLDLAATLREVTARFAEESARSGCRIDVIAAAPVVGHWDRGRVEQVITNLLSNAIKYGAGKPVTASVSRAGERAVLEIADQGIGIDPAHQSRIFERFERAVSERHYGGLGLGLWIARQIIEAHGGSISVRSMRDRGATFTVDLPARAAHPTSPPNLRDLASKGDHP
jgi:PAS domain S-box-containing protein